MGYYIQLAGDRLQIPSSILHIRIYVYKLTYWLFQCNFNVHHWLNHLCSCKIVQFFLQLSNSVNVCIILDLATFLAAVVQARSIHHKPVGREVYQHWTKLSCISMSKRQAKIKVVLAHSAIKHIVQDFSGTRCDVTLTCRSDFVA